MPTGLSLPIRANPSGGLAKVSGDEQDQKVIALALLSDDNENSFQQNNGLGISMVFDIQDPNARAEILMNLRRVFQRFERLKRFKLKENTIQWTDDNDKEGVAVLSFKYIALESDSEKDFSKRYFSADSGAGGTASSNG